VSEDVLPPAEFRVLLALIDGPKHGHGIRLDVRDRTDGRVDMGPGTLYGAIKRLVRREWITEVAPPAGEEGDGRRRFYALTGPGRAAVAGETDRMRELLAIAAAKQGSEA
jgi:DNA-binding PadR family transcriptional regulator